MTKIFVLLTLCSVVSCHPSGNGGGIMPRSGGIGLVWTEQEQHRGKACKTDDAGFSVSTTLIQCQEKCKQNLACVGISYTPGHRFCRLCPTLEDLSSTGLRPGFYDDYANYEISGLIASDGTVLEKSSTNANCCSENSISGAEDGSTPRWSLAWISKMGELTCHGGMKQTFAEWIDMAAGFLSGEGICYRGWSYVKST